ncbi:MAG: helix-turn-helix transcriptional regulator [Burkholderiaceae bacterium]|jgi:DNA-binding HxlR family transcriptional regulator|nr:helix-turn-helix transcriptional regulator [Burkholderiaceae bacterium]
MNRGFGQFCPVAMASEVFAERWTPIILRELLSGSHRFNEIHRSMPLISRALLARRLRELEAAGVVASVPAGTGHGREYRLTEAGQEFRAAIDALGAWGQRWTKRVQPGNLDAGLLMWSIRRRIATDRLPARRIVVRFSFEAVPSNSRSAGPFWLLLEPAVVDVCLSDPGLDVDVYVDADLGAMTAVWLGDLSFEAATRTGKIRLTGLAPLVREFPSWLLLSRFAGVPRPRPPA